MENEILSVLVEYFCDSWHSIKHKGRHMQKLKLTLTAVILVLGTMTASAQSSLTGAASLQAQVKNATPIVHQAACNGFTGGCGCAPGWISACRDRCCKCIPCR
jgi:hypothetical protein